MEKNELAVRKYGEKKTESIARDQFIEMIVDEAFKI
ncbi:MAG: hypothetical protein L0I79_06665 [Atopostipes sp.]|nr:hypothetical protein [Atopostipes sp.]